MYLISFINIENFFKWLSYMLIRIRYFNFR